jgi:hypothetical protein
MREIIIHLTISQNPSAIMRGGTEEDNEGQSACPHPVYIRVLQTTRVDRFKYVCYL